jgi:hypothetical protein
MAGPGGAGPRGSRLKFAGLGREKCAQKPVIQTIASHKENVYIARDFTLKKNHEQAYPLFHSYLFYP